MIQFVKERLAKPVHIRVLMALMVLAGMVILLVVIRKIGKHFRSKGVSKEKETAIRVICSILRAAVIVAAIVLELQACGVNVSGTIAGLGLLGVLAGFAFQDFIRDVISGMIILSDRFFMVGDVISFEGQEGMVVHFNIRTTRIKLLSDRSVLNINNRLLTYTHRISHQLNIDVLLPYEEKVEKVDQVLQGAMEKMNEIEGVESTRYEGITDFRDSGLNYRIYVRCEQTKRPHITHLCNQYIFRALQEHDIHIPYNTYTILQDGQKHNVSKNIDSPVPEEE